MEMNIRIRSLNDAEDNKVVYSVEEVKDEENTKKVLRKAEKKRKLSIINETSDSLSQDSDRIRDSSEHNRSTGERQRNRSHGKHSSRKSEKKRGGRSRSSTKSRSPTVEKQEKRKRIELLSPAVKIERMRFENMSGNTDRRILRESTRRATVLVKMRRVMELRTEIRQHYEFMREETNVLGSFLSTTQTDSALVFRCAKIAKQVDGSKQIEKKHVKFGLFCLLKNQFEKDNEILKEAYEQFKSEVN